jgi:dihydroflavonol-4-reductase
MADNHVSETVLVTGGTGYLAGWVIAGLLQRGYRVRTTVRSVDKAQQVRDAVSEQAGGQAAGTIEFVAADLLGDEGWDRAIAGADHVLHTASPMPFGAGVDLVTTAREGTRRVLAAAARAGVRRAVLTSSGVAADTGDPDTPATETTWTTQSGTPVRAYPDSKILAERDAWDLAATTGLELAAVLPTFMQGPMLGTMNRPGTVEIIRRLLAGRIPAVPNIGWNVVDVRDIAELHILAMTSPAAAGQRFLGSGTSCGTATSPASSARGSRTKPPRSPRAPCLTSSSSCLRGGTRRWRCCAPNSAASGSSTAARHVLSSAGIPAPPNRRSSTPPPRSSPNHERASGSPEMIVLMPGQRQAARRRRRVECQSVCPGVGRNADTWWPVDEDLQATTQSRARPNQTAG